MSKKWPSIVSFVLFFSAISPIAYSQNTIPAKTGNIEENSKIINAYLSMVEKKKIIVPLGKFGWPKVRKYWATVPVLNDARSFFEEQNNNLITILLKDKDYKQLRSDYKNKQLSGCEFRKKKCAIFHHLYKTNEEYRAARKLREEALYLCNLMTLEYIIEEYAKQGKPFPVDWIPKSKCHKCGKANTKHYTLKHFHKHQNTPQQSTPKPSLKSKKAGYKKKFSYQNYKDYWQQIPDLRNARQAYETADKKLKEILINNPDYNKTVNDFKSKKLSLEEFEKRKESVQKKLLETNDAYQQSKKKRDKLFIISNKKTYAYSKNLLK